MTDHTKIGMVAFHSSSICQMRKKGHSWVDIAASLDLPPDTIERSYKWYVASLNERQQRNDLHPYTCGKDSRHNDGRLVSTERGWICPDCDYTQPF